MFCIRKYVVLSHLFSFSLSLTVFWGTRRLNRCSTVDCFVYVRDYFRRNWNTKCRLYPNWSEKRKTTAHQKDVIEKLQILTLYFTTWGTSVSSNQIIKLSHDELYRPQIEGTSETSCCTLTSINLEKN